MSRNADAEAEFHRGQPSTAIAALFTASRSGEKGRFDVNRRGGRESCRRHPSTARAEARTRLSNPLQALHGIPQERGPKVKTSDAPTIRFGKTGGASKTAWEAAGIYRFFLRSHRRPAELAAPIRFPDDRCSLPSDDRGGRLMCRGGPRVFSFSGS